MKAFKSMREFMKALDDGGDLVRVKAKVDKAWEISTVSRQMCFSYKLDQRPALLFENIQGFGMPLLLNETATPRRAAMALGIFTEDGAERRKLMREKFWSAYENKQKPRVVKNAPCKENIVKGKDIDLLKLLPVPIWTPGKDVSPYITAGGTTSRDPATGEQSIGNYRLQLKGKNRLGIYAGDGQDTFYHWKKAFALNKPLPVAVIIGPPPTVLFPQIYRVPYDELQIAGGFDGEPLEAVKCETNDILVPAHTEIVIEGEIPPNVFEEEGPFGEAFGVISPQRPRPIINVKAVTYRHNPIYHAFMSSYVPGTASATRASVKPFFVHNTLRLAGVPEVKDVFLPEAATGTQILIVSIKKMWAFHPRHIMHAIWGSKASHDCKFIIVTDEDVNIRDPFELNRAIFMNVNPARDVVITEGGSWTIDPSLGSSTEQRSTTAAKMGIDATRPYGYDIALPDAGHFNKVKAQWDKYGIKPLERELEILY